MGMPAASDATEGTVGGFCEIRLTKSANEEYGV